MSFDNTSTPKKPTGKAKWQIPKRPSAKNPQTMEFYLEGELKEKFCREFPKHSNRRLMQWFGISFSTLQRLKRSLGLEKNMTAIRKELAKDVKKICEDNGYYDSLRGKKPSEACLEGARKKRNDGFVPILEFKKKNPRKYKQLMEKRSSDRKKLISKERRRVELGLEPKTNIPSFLLHINKPFTKAEISKRYRATTLGYIISVEPEDRYTLFYDDNTDRRKIFERNCISIGMKIEEWTE